MKENNKAGIWMVLGAGIGGGIGIVLHHMVLGISFGAAFGLIIGSMVSSENKNDDNT